MVGLLPQHGKKTRFRWKGWQVFWRAARLTKSVNARQVGGEQKTGEHNTITEPGITWITWRAYCWCYRGTAIYKKGATRSRIL
jgi:hypothetical protein